MLQEIQWMCPFFQKFLYTRQCIIFIIFIWHLFCWIGVSAFHRRLNKFVAYGWVPGNRSPSLRPERPFRPSSLLLFAVLFIASSSIDDLWWRISSPKWHHFLLPLHNHFGSFFLSILLPHPCRLKFNVTGQVTVIPWHVHVSHFWHSKTNCLFNFCVNLAVGVRRGIRPRNSWFGTRIQVGADGMWTSTDFQGSLFLFNGINSFRGFIITCDNINPRLSSRILFGTAHSLSTLFVVTSIETSKSSLKIWDYQNLIWRRCRSGGMTTSGSPLL